MSVSKNLSMNDTTNAIENEVNQLIREKKTLQEELRLHKEMIRQLSKENEMLRDFCFRGQFTLKSALGNSEGSGWIRGTWLSCSKTVPCLLYAEKAWKDGDDQKALLSLSSLLKRNTLKCGHKIQVNLLCSAILLSSGNSSLALGNAETALAMALEKKVHDLVGKAQFHMGLCYLDLEIYGEARASFIFASQTTGYESATDYYLQLVEQNYSQITKGHERNFAMEQSVSLSSDESCPNPSTKHYALESFHK